MQAFNAFKAGVKDLLFPAGTYWLRRFAAVACDLALTDQQHSQRRFRSPGRPR